MAKGFLGLGATFDADLNLVVQLLMGVALLAGAVLARRGRYKAHQYCQTSVVVLNLLLIAGIMLPAFRKQVFPRLATGFHDAYHAVAFVHGLLGLAAELLGIYIVLVATRVLPERLRFNDYKRWMRTALGLWWTVIVIGVATYGLWYAPAKAPAQAAAPAPGGASVKVVEFDFVPKELTVKAGTVVTWSGLIGKHTVEAYDGSFKSDPDAKGDRFEHRFDKAGTYEYFCEYHGEKGVKGMLGVVRVEAAP